MPRIWAAPGTLGASVVLDAISLSSNVLTWPELTALAVAISSDNQHPAFEDPGSDPSS